MKHTLPIMIYPSLADELVEVVQPGDTLNFVSCLGGSVDAALKLIELIKSKQLNVHCEFICASAAAVVFLSCPNQRTATKYARFLLHETRFDNFIESNVTTAKLENYIEELSQYDDLFSELIAENLDTPVEKVSELIHENNGEGVWYSAEELLQKLPNAFDVVTVADEELILQMVAQKIPIINVYLDNGVDNKEQTTTDTTTTASTEEVKQDDLANTIKSMTEDFSKAILALNEKIEKLTSDVQRLSETVKENKQESTLQSLLNIDKSNCVNSLPSLEDYLKTFEKL